MRGFQSSVLACTILLVSCAQFPDLDDVVSDQARKGPFPSLVPIEGLLLTSAEDINQAKSDAQSLAARARALRQRARAMQGPVIDRRTRAKMTAALIRHPIANGR